MLITDREGRIVVILVGRPAGDATWDAALQGVQEALAETAAALRFGDSQFLPARSSSVTENRRGDFRTAAVGVSYGGGQKVSWSDAGDALAHLFF